MVYNLVDGTRTVQQIIDRCPITEFHACKALYELLIRNIIEIVPPKEPVIQEAVAKPAEEKKEISKATFGIIAIIILLISLASIGLNIYSPFGFYFNYPIEIKNIQHKDYSLEKMIKLKEAIKVYNCIYRKIPASLEEVKQVKLIDNNDTKDPWGREYKYESDMKSFMIKGYSSADSKSEDLIIYDYFAFKPAQDMQDTSEKSTTGVEVLE